MAVPGTGSTNQAMTLAAFKKLAGKANTSALREFYEETIPSNIQINTKVIFGDDIPQTVNTSALYAQFSSSAGGTPIVEFVEFYVQSVSGTTYDANTGSFGDVGFGAGDESQSSGPHGFELVLTSSYQTLSSNNKRGTGVYLNNQVVHATNGALQLVSPSFGPQSGNNYALELWTAKPSNGGSRIFPTDPIDWIVDYFNGIVFIQDYKSTKVPTYARGFIYIGNFADQTITNASTSGVIGSVTNGAQDRVATFSGTGSLNGETNLTFDGNKLNIQGGVIHKRRQVTSTTTAAATDYYIGVSSSSTMTINLPNASTLTNGQTYVIKDEAGTLSDSVKINIAPAGGQTIEGQASISLSSPFAAINLYTDGSTKYFIY